MKLTILLILVPTLTFADSIEFNDREIKAQEQQIKMMENNVRKATLGLSTDGCYFAPLVSVTTEKPKWKAFHGENRWHQMYVKICPNDPIIIGRYEDGGNQ